MKIFREYLQEQHFLLPPSLDEFVPDDHEVRIVSEVVDRINLSALMNKYEGGGAPAFHPAMMLKVIIYAYSMGISSSRRIARALKTDTAFMFLSGLQCPDFRTICLFRSQHADVIPELFVEVVRLCAHLGMVGLGHVAIDGTKLRANASVRQSKDRSGLDKEIEHIKEQVKEMLKESARIDDLEDREYGDNDGSQISKELKNRQYRLRKLEEAKKMLEQEKLNKINITDPDSPLMPDSHKRIKPCYNGQVAVDDKKQIIVAAAISQDPTDYAGFKAMLEQTEANLGDMPKQSSADSGFFSYDNLEYADTVKIDAYIPDNMLEWLDGKPPEEKKYDKSNFWYDVEKDIYICPEGKLLRRAYEQKRKGKPAGIIYAGESCDVCCVKEMCTHARVRTIWRDGREGLLEAMRTKLRSEEGKQTYLKRMYTVEPVFGDIKWNLKMLMISLRGLVKVKGEFALLCLVHNLKKIVKGVNEGTVILSFEKREEMVAGATL